MAIRCEDETRNESFSCYEQKWLSPTHELFILLFAVVILITLACNGFIIFTVIRYPKLQVHGNVLVASLAVTDMLVAVIVMPFAVVEYLTRYWYLGEAICNLRMTVDVTFTTVSMLHLLAIAFDRFFAIKFVHKRRKIKFNLVYIYIPVIWAVSLIIVLSGIAIGGCPPIDEVGGVCLINQDQIYTVFSTGLAFWIPFGFTAFFNLSIWYSANKQMKKVQAMAAGIAEQLAPRVEETKPVEKDEGRERSRSLIEDKSLEANMDQIIIEKTKSEDHGDDKVPDVNASTADEAGDKALDDKEVEAPGKKPETDGEETADGGTSADAAPGGESANKNQSARSGQRTFKRRAANPARITKEETKRYIHSTKMKQSINRQNDLDKQKMSIIAREKASSDFDKSRKSAWTTHSTSVPGSTAVNDAEAAFLRFQDGIKSYPVLSTGTVSVICQRPGLIPSTAWGDNGPNIGRQRSLRPDRQKPGEPAKVSVTFIGGQDGKASITAVGNCLHSTRNSEVAKPSLSDYHGETKKEISAKAKSLDGSQKHTYWRHRGDPTSNSQDFNAEKHKRMPALSQQDPNRNASNSEGEPGIAAGTVAMKQKIAQQEKGTKREVKLSIVLIIITAAYAICWVPFFLIASISPFLAQPPLVGEPYLTLALWLGYANSFINPILYTAFNGAFRKVFRLMFCRRKVLEQELTFQSYVASNTEAQ